MRLSLLFVCVGLQFVQMPSAAALTYRSVSGFSKAINPGLACWARPSYDIWTRRNYQSFQIKMYPRKLIYPCRRGIPNAVIGGWFESFKLSGDRSEACYGKFTMWFSNYGRNLKIAFTTKGQLRGMYCLERGRTQTFQFLPGR